MNDMALELAMRREQESKQMALELTMDLAMSMVTN